MATLYTLPQDVRNLIKDMLPPRDYFHTLQVAWLFHDPNTELQRKLRKTQEYASQLQRQLSIALCSKCGQPCPSCKDTPRKPKTAYMLFIRDVSPAMRRDNPDLDFAQIRRRIEYQWQKLQLEKRMHYQTLAERDQIRYRREIAEYKNSADTRGTRRILRDGMM